MKSYVALALVAVFAAVSANLDEGVNPHHHQDHAGAVWDNILLTMMRDQVSCQGRPVYTAHLQDINLHTCSRNKPHGRGIQDDIQNYPCLFRCIMHGIGWLDENYEVLHDKDEAVELGLKAGVYDEGQLHAIIDAAVRDGCHKILPVHGTDDCTKYTKGLQCVATAIMKTCAQLPR